jgi:hypothetical protein
MLTDELLAYVFDDPSHPLAGPMAVWFASSRRFADFVDSYHTKIRKKIRIAQDPESLRNLHLELETAYLLLRERSLSLAYEPLRQERKRSPDFAVTFTSSVTFALEVTRMQADLKEPLLTPALPVGERLVDPICSKLGQLLPQQGNVLLVGVEDLDLRPDDLRAVMLRIQQRVERDDAGFLKRHRFRDRADFFRHYQRLSEILVRGNQLKRAAGLVVWINPQAKHPLPPKVRTAFHRSQAG